MTPDQAKRIAAKLRLLTSEQTDIVFGLDAAGERVLAALADDAQRASELLLQDLQERLSLLEASDASLSVPQAGIADETGDALGT